MSYHSASNSKIKIQNIFLFDFSKVKYHNLFYDSFNENILFAKIFGKNDFKVCLL